MKNIAITLFCLFTLATGFAQQQLPAEASQTISTFFPQSQVTAVSQYDASNEFAYRVDLDADIIIYFDANGRWLLAESFSSDISQLLSAQIKTSIEVQNCRPQNTVSIRRNNDNTTKVIYNDGLAHLFDANGQFLREVSR